MADPIPHDKLDAFNRLLRAATDASFDCGAYDDPDNPNDLEHYKALVAKADAAKEALRQFVFALSAERAAEPSNELIHAIGTALFHPFNALNPAMREKVDEVYKLIAAPSASGARLEGQTIEQWAERAKISEKNLAEYMDDGAHLYCLTCGSCGIEECCPPGKCWKARYEELQAQINKADRGSESA